MKYFSKSLISIADMNDGSARLVQFFNHSPEDVRAERRETNISYGEGETRESLFAKLNDDHDHVIDANGKLQKLVLEAV